MSQDLIFSKTQKLILLLYPPLLPLRIPEAEQSHKSSSASPQLDYDHIIALLRRADYSTAEKAIGSFLQRYPEHELAGNVAYWLGETFYVRKAYAAAAQAFAEGIESYDQSVKIPDMLLKLGSLFATSW